jgi:hypothetical protein
MFGASVLRSWLLAMALCASGRIFFSLAQNAVNPEPK